MKNNKNGQANETSTYDQRKYQISLLDVIFYERRRTFFNSPVTLEQNENHNIEYRHNIEYWEVRKA